MSHALASCCVGSKEKRRDREVRRADTRNRCSRVFVSRRSGFLGPRLAETEAGAGAVSGLSESITPRGGHPGAAPRAASHRTRTRETSAPRAGAGRMPGSWRSPFWTTWLEGTSWTMERLQGLHRISCFWYRSCLPSPAAALPPSGSSRATTCSWTRAAFATSSPRSWRTSCGPPLPGAALDVPTFRVRRLAQAFQRSGHLARPGADRRTRFRIWPGCPAPLWSTRSCTRTRPPDLGFLSARGSVGPTALCADITQTLSLLLLAPQSPPSSMGRATLAHLCICQGLALSGPRSPHLPDGKSHPCPPLHLARFGPVCTSVSPFAQPTETSLFPPSA
ncbi:uncharacterized protein LOC133078029 isoform X1 [Eubalaena glacialis]|uniref:uncharacterized protein LOC133078029 isoform X1 n=1 Tax=Eubalaena glacialis TaxID=27606 RepID=UPI002A5A19B2|nr:uncharacterized protein LOC133078029 isoform X1 [Eubalaena glacialis]XP_061028869.1 uncharacterized protein LOC133078029 isoform X1 [Eubalaena glacialis]